MQSLAGGTANTQGEGVWGEISFYLGPSQPGKLHIYSSHTHIFSLTLNQHFFQGSVPESSSDTKERKGGARSPSGIPSVMKRTNTFVQLRKHYHSACIYRGIVLSLHI